MIKYKISLIILFLLFIFLHFYGINWGIPNSRVSSLIFKDIENIKKFTPAMLNTYLEIREIQSYYGIPYPSNYQQKEKVIIKLDGDKRVSKELINSCRSYLIRSSGADEQRGIIALSKMTPSKLDFNPRFYEYGGVYLYPMGAFFYLLSKLKILVLTSDMSFYFLHPEEMGKIYMYGRIFGATGAFISIIVFFWICKELFQDKRLIYLLTFFYGTSAGFVMWSHYLKPFSYGLLWFLSAIYFLIRFYKAKDTKWLYTASIFSGLSFGTLLTYGYIYWAVVIFILFFNKDIKWKIKNLIFTFIIFLGVFLITNPYVFLSHKEFLQEIVYLRTYWHKEVSIKSILIFLFNTLRYGMGTLLWITVIIGFLLGFVYKSEKLNWMFLIIILPAFLYFAFTTPEWVHYSIFLYPFLILSAGFFFSRIRLKIVEPILIIVALYTILYACSYVNLLGRENIRIEAGRWINENIPSDKTIGLLEAPSPWRTPPFRFLDYKIIIAQNKTEIEKEKPAYFIVSEYQWLRGTGIEAIKEILSGYEIFKKFEKKPSLGWIKFKYPEYIPYDWCHPNPVILIWKRKEL